MKWVLFGTILLLAVAIYTIIAQELRYVELQRYAQTLTALHTAQEAALVKCIRNGYRNL